MTRTLTRTALAITAALALAAPAFAGPGLVESDAAARRSPTTLQHRRPSASPAPRSMIAGAYPTSPPPAFVGPPAPPLESVRPTRAGALWIPGRYRWLDGGYQWVGGQWQRQDAQRLWLAGMWVQQGDRHVWIEGRWQ